MWSTYGRLGFATGLILGAVMLGGRFDLLPRRTSGRPIARGELQYIVGQGGCTEILPPQDCGPESYCTDNPCTGDPYWDSQANEWRKHCNQVLQTDKVRQFEFYEPVVTVNESRFEYVDIDMDACFSVCPCQDYCLDENPDPSIAKWRCQTQSGEDQCAETGWVFSYNYYILGSGCSSQ